MASIEEGVADRPPLRQRVFQIVQMSERALTQSDVRKHLADQGATNEEIRDAHKRLSELVDDGEIARAGAKGKAIYFVPPEDYVPDSKQTKAERLVEMMDNATLRKEAKEILEERQGRRQALTLLRLYEKDEERRRAWEAKERERMAEAQRTALVQRIRYWEAFKVTLSHLDEVICQYIREFDELPPPIASTASLIDIDMNELRQHLNYLEAKLFPGRIKGKGGLRGGSIIDVDT